MTSKIASIALVAAALTGAAAPALAQPAATAQLVSIGYSDLNLASDAGRATLQTRIDNAADRACAYNGVVSLREIMFSSRCRDDFQAKAEAQVSQRYAATSAQTMTAASH